MGKKTVWAICAFNILASGFAIAWVTRSYWQPRPKPMFAEGAKPAIKDSDTCWAEFTSASTYAEACQALASMSPDERHPKLSKFIKIGGDGVNTGETAVEAGRQAAALAFWGDTVETGSAEDAWLRELALERSRSALEREAALKAVILAAHRRHKATTADADQGWREPLAAFLEQNDFGRGCSVEGLALQARSFALVEKIAPISREALIGHIGLLLLPKNGASESVIVSALDVARQLGAAELLDAVRVVARHPRSDACQQAALAYLAEQGTQEDLSWLRGYVPASASVHLVATNVRAVLANRLRAGAHPATTTADANAPQS